MRGFEAPVSASRYFGVSRSEEAMVGEVKHDDDDHPLIVKDWMFVAVGLPLFIMFLVVVVLPALT